MVSRYSVEYLHMAHAGGRPTKYLPEFVDMVYEYINTTGREQMSLPTIQGLAIYIGVNKDTLNEWGKQYPQFSVALSDLHSYQAQQLINDGIYGGKEVNSTIVKLLLMNNHGMMERKDTTTDGKALPTPIFGGVSNAVPTDDEKEH